MDAGIGYFCGTIELNEKTTCRIIIGSYVYCICPGENFPKNSG